MNIYQDENGVTVLDAVDEVQSLHNPKRRQQQKSSAFETYVDEIPGSYRKEFSDFVRQRSGKEPRDVDGLDIDRYYSDFLETMLVGGFDYWRADDEYPPLVRSVVKSGDKYDFGDELPIEAKSMIVESDLVGAYRCLLRSGYDAVPLIKNSKKTKKQKAFYTGTGYSGVHDPHYDMPPDSSFFNRTNFEKLKRFKKLIIDGNTVRVEERRDAAGDPITVLNDVVAFNTQDALQAWLKNINAKQVADRQYEIGPADIEADKTWMR